MRLALTLLILPVVLAACGADGAPIRPTEKPAPAISISGDAQLGVVIK